MTILRDGGPDLLHDVLVHCFGPDARSQESGSQDAHASLACREARAARTAQYSEEEARAKEWANTVAANQAAYQAENEAYLAEDAARPWFARRDNVGPTALGVVLLIALVLAWKYRSRLIRLAKAGGKVLSRFLYAATGYRVTDAVRRWRSFDRDA